MSDSLIHHILPTVHNPDLEWTKYQNFLLALEARQRGALLNQAKPFAITVDLSTSCHLSCPYCSVGNGTIRRPKALMSEKLHQDLIEELGAELFVIWYFSTGEPLLNRKLPAIIAQNQGKEIFSAVSTNLSVNLDQTFWDDLLQSGLGLLSVSLDGTSREVYQKYRVGGDFELATRNLRRLIERKKELGLKYPVVMWRFLLFAHNSHQIKQVCQTATDWGVDLVEFYPGVTPPTPEPGAVNCFKGPLNLPTFSSPFLKVALRRQDSPLRKLLSDYPEVTEIVQGPHNPICDWPYFGAVIYPDGAVGPCCVINDQEGDLGEVILNQRSFLEIWNGESYQKIRRQEQGTVCSACPLPAAQYYQFRNTLKAILLNAPAWVLSSLANEPDRFFLPIDRERSGREVEPFFTGTLFRTALA